MVKKILLGLVALVVIAIVAAVIFTGSRLDDIVADAVESYTSTATGTRAAVAGVDIALGEGSGTIRGLTIDNPEGFNTDYALRIEDIDVALDVTSLARAVPVVKEIVVENAHLNAEQRGSATNITTIQEHMSSVDADTADTATEGRIVIDRFVLKNGRVTVVSDALDEPEELMLDDVVVTGIGRSTGGATYGDATEAILNPILGATRTAIERRLGESAADAARKKIEERAGEKLKDLLDRD